MTAFSERPAPVATGPALGEAGEAMPDETLDEMHRR